MSDQTCPHCKHKQDSGSGCFGLVLILILYLFFVLPVAKELAMVRDHTQRRLDRLEERAGLAPLPSPGPPSLVPWKYSKTTKEAK